MDAYIDVVSGEIRALLLPDEASENDEDPQCHTVQELEGIELPQKPLKYGSSEFERRVSGELTVTSSRRSQAELNRPMAKLVAATCAAASCSLAACWVAITVDCLKMLKIYGPHSILFMQLAYNLPVLPIVMMQKNFGEAASRLLGGSMRFVLLQATIAFVGNGAMCSFWGDIMNELVDGAWVPWALCWVAVGVFSATGYGAFLFAVRLFDNRSKTWFVRGFNICGLSNLCILVLTGGPLFSSSSADEHTDDLYYHSVGGVVWGGFALTLFAFFFACPEIAERFAEFDRNNEKSKVGNQAWQDQGSDNQQQPKRLQERMSRLHEEKNRDDSPSKQHKKHQRSSNERVRSDSGGGNMHCIAEQAPTSSRVLREKSSLWMISAFGLQGAMVQTSISFTCSIATFALFSYAPSDDCQLPLVLTYTSMFCDVAGQFAYGFVEKCCGQYFVFTPARDRNTRRGAELFARALVVGRLLLSVAYIRVLAWPVSQSFSGYRTDKVIIIIAAMTQFLGAILSRHNYSRVAAACNAGVSLATASPVTLSNTDHETSSRLVRKGTSLVSLSVFIGCYMGFALALVAIASKLERGWHYWDEIRFDEGNWYSSGMDDDGMGTDSMAMSMNDGMGTDSMAMSMNTTNGNDMDMDMGGGPWWKPVCEDRRHPVMPAWCRPHFWHSECPAV